MKTTNQRLLSMDKLRGSIIKNALVILSCSLIGISIVCTANLFFKDFFFIDDAQNENLPFYKEMGRMWLSGHLPILTTNTYFGGNILVDMVLSPFAPQTILTSLLSTKIDSLRLLSNFLAWLNISLVVLGGYWLGRILEIRSSYAFLLGFMISTNPVFIYVFSASWWNLATAFAWFVVSIAALLAFCRDQSGSKFVLAVFSICALFASAGTQMQFAFILFVIALLVFDYREYESLLRLWKLLVIGVCSVSISAIPIMGEYLFSSDLVERLNGFHNVDNFLVTSWSNIINFFNPLFGNYMHWFGGYRYIPISLGYVGIISLVLIFFTKNEKKDKYSDLIYVLTLISLVLVISPSQFGSLRYPFRYLPILSMMGSLLVVYKLETAQVYFSKQSFKRFYSFVIIAALIQLFSSDELIFKWPHVLSVLFFMMICAILLIGILFLKDNLITHKPQLA
jgi:hypothetical protein